MMEYLNKEGFRQFCRKVRQALQRKSNPNLLDNWYFVGGGSQKGGGQFPINQRGQTEYTASGCTIDRWRMASGKLMVNDDCIVVSADEGADGYIYQNFENLNEPIGMTLTLSIFASGTGSIVVGIDGVWPTGIWYAGVDTFDVRSTTFTVPGAISTGFGVHIQTKGGFKIKAIKLELGSEQTLAYQENDVWVLNEIPDYATELAKCQRYQLALPYVESSPFCFMATKTDRLVGSFSFPTTMRVRPTLSSVVIRDIDTAAVFSPSSYYFSGTDNGIYAFDQMQPANLTVGHFYSVSAFVDANL